jgi:hypothetical protein
MSINIVIQPPQTVSLDVVEILAMIDDFDQKKITAMIKGLPKNIVLWSGDEEYAAAGNWTNETATAQTTALLSLSSIPWA